MDMDRQLRQQRDLTGIGHSQTKGAIESGRVDRGLPTRCRRDCVQGGLRQFAQGQHQSIARPHEQRIARQAAQIAQMQRHAGLGQIERIGHGVDAAKAQHIARHARLECEQAIHPWFKSAKPP